MRIIQWLRSRLLYKMLLLYSLLTLIPLIIVSASFYAKSKNLLEKDSTETAQKALLDASDRMDNFLKGIAKKLNQTAENDPKKNSLINSLLLSKVESDQKELEPIVMRLLLAQKDDLVDTIYLQSLIGKSYSVGSKAPLQFEEAFRIMPFEYDYVPEWAFFTDGKRLACNLKLFDKRSGADIGRLILTLDPKKVTSLYEQFPVGNFYITNASSNLILSANDETQIGKLLNIHSQTNMVALTQKSRATDFQYVYLIPSKPGQIITKQAFFSVYVTLLAWLAVILITFWILRKINVPITRLTRLMRKAEQEEYNLMQDIRTTDEIALLCHGYNQLVSRTQELIEKNYNSGMLQKEAELNAVRMYINPHFLYNTLEYISILSRSQEGSENIADVVQNLAGIFRFSIAPGETTVPLETELLFVNKYLLIHQRRYGKRLHYEIIVPESLKSIPVPKLILQPLVENAFTHGIDYMHKDGHVIVRAYEEDFRLVIEIENSVGDPSETHEHVYERKGLGSGLQNVNARIHFHYGPEYGVALHKETNITLARVNLPITFE
ncbi:HAMP domain-containing protein [Paenibacillus psychroresistens]|uniref:HAMP domain-containing protein n=1 Tax=Paenibacillus psychroresistens TaxID=1778678 RepID=A0A6B8RV55_9BACL|nr:histidine kinase [Paenibacillus psychroresistens]QGQ99505.1 HAMP domain-containing protein [Paenibacillus psychroresistens]